jgi:hypothetical protein
MTYYKAGEAARTNTYRDIVSKKTEKKWVRRIRRQLREDKATEYFIYICAVYAAIVLSENIPRLIYL